MCLFMFHKYSLFIWFCNKKWFEARTRPTFQNYKAKQTIHFLSGSAEKQMFLSLFGRRTLPLSISRVIFVRRTLPPSISRVICFRWTLPPSISRVFLFSADFAIFEFPSRRRPRPPAPPRSPVSPGAAPVPRRPAPDVSSAEYPTASPNAVADPAQRPRARPPSGASPLPGGRPPRGARRRGAPSPRACAIRRRPCPPAPRPVYHPPPRPPHSAPSPAPRPVPVRHQRPSPATRPRPRG